MSMDDLIVKILLYVKQNHQQIFSQQPEQVAQQVLDAIKSYGVAGKIFVRAKWTTIKYYLLDPSRIMLLVKQYDEQAYRILMRHTSWLNRFFYTLYQLLKQYAGA